MWLGLSDVNAAAQLRWVDGSRAQEGEEGLPPHSPVVRGNLCVSLDQRSQTSSHSCNAKRAYVCQYNPEGRHQALAQMTPHTNKHLHTVNHTEYLTCASSPHLDLVPRLPLQSMFQIQGSLQWAWLCFLPTSCSTPPQHRARLRPLPTLA